MIDALDGDINFNKQQNAYIDSLIGEENSNYIEDRRFYDVNFEFILLKDISGSKPYLIPSNSIIV
jgi:hypothetical protein